MTAFRPRCPEGRHTGAVPGKLFCTVCGRMCDETDEEYAAAEEAHRTELRLQELEREIRALDGGPVEPQDRYLAYLEAYARILRAVREDAAPDVDEESLN
jgi:DNA-binding SARP family transcriptional activator